jgi:hypothetical protein
MSQRKHWAIFVELEELTCFISAMDIYLTSQLTRAQISSGTPAYPRLREQG